MDEDFHGFERKKGLFPGPFRLYHRVRRYHAQCDGGLPRQKLENIFGEYISKLGLTQLRIAETEKYAHVTFFFNGGV